VKDRDSSAGDDQMTSLLSNIDSMSDMSEVDDSADEVSSQCGQVYDAKLNAPPLFIQLMCTVKGGSQVYHCPVTSLPVCLKEVVSCLDNFGPAIDLERVRVRLDILCLTLPPTILNTLVVR
jgi:hypothetical protein